MESSNALAALTPAPTPTQTAPRVWVEAVAPEDPVANGVGGFRVWRDGTAGDLAVRYAISGSAAPGADYAPLSGTVVITDGNCAATVVPEPLRVDSSSAAREVTLTLVPAPSYTPGGGWTGTTRLGARSTASQPAPVDPSAPPAFAGGGPAGLSSHPIRYSDGMVIYSTTDLVSDGFGQPWGVSRSWYNLSTYGNHTDFGNGWVDSERPYLFRVDLTGQVIVVAGETPTYFSPSGGAYVPDYFTTDQLAYDATAGEFVLTNAGGDRYRFCDFATSLPTEQRGRLKQVTDRFGNTTAVTTWTSAGKPGEVQRSATVGGATVTESYLYSYVSGGVNDGRVSSVVLRRRAGTGAWSTIREAAYTYYDGVEAHGNATDLKTAVVKDGSGNVLDTEYYRYYTGESGGYVHGLKYAFRGDSYARLAAAFSTPASATDTQVAPYADHYFEYDANRRATTEVAKGAGDGGTYGGQGTFTFSYTLASAPSGVNAWAKKTVETLPDGNQNVVYVNTANEVLLSAFVDVATSTQWVTAYHYDSAGRLEWVAQPSAVIGYSDTYVDLFNFSLGTSSYLRDAAGLFQVYSYFASTTATSSTAGGVAGYLQNTSLRQGELGTAVLQEQDQYISRTDSGGTTIYLAATETQYRADNGTGAQATSYSYTWSGTGFAVQTLTTTYPVVTTSQNGSGTAVTETTAFDAMGYSIWFKDTAGGLTYQAYDVPTGSVVKTITDVDTTQTSDFTALPSGWSTPSGGGLHLKTVTQVDALGRPTAITAPNGNVTYTVYDDPDFEVRVYEGWNSSTGRPTGPTQVYREDRANGYSETLVMSAAPATSGGAPTGAEAITGLQALSRTYVTVGGQVSYADSYFNLSGLTYSTSTSFGTQGTNFYRTTNGYDAKGRFARTVSAQGTIYRTVYDGLGRAVSEWVGLDDAPTSGAWSPTNTAGTDLVKVREYEYDNGGVGDSNLTKVTEYPGGGAAARVTQTWYDWRNRAVAVKYGVEASESTSVNRQLVYYTYDNLDQVTMTQVYDADTVTPTVSGGVPQAPASTLLRAQDTVEYDELGRVFRTRTYSVNTSTGAVSTNSLATDVWYDARGLVLKQSAPNGLVQKWAYDGAGRVTTAYTGDWGSDAGYADADDVVGDTVLTQTEYVYDPSGNVRQVTVRDRFHDATGTGALGTPTTGIAARVSYAGYYYDLADRMVAAVDVGTNGGSSWTRPGTVPSRSATVLVTSTKYATDAVQVIKLTGSPTGGTFTLSFGGSTTSALAYNASAATVQTALAALTSIGSGNVQVLAAAGGGWEVRFIGTKASTYQSAITGSGAGLTGGSSPAVATSTIYGGGDAGAAAEVTDPAGRVTRTYTDALGRTTRSVENFVDGVVSDTDDKTVGYAYNGAGATSVTAYLTGGGVQTTGYVYGVTVATGSTIQSNDVVRLTQWADPTTGAPSSSQQQAVTLDALGEVLTTTDRNGSVHTFTYDVLGRVVSDTVTTLGAGVDGAVRRVETGYSTTGEVQSVTSYSAVTGGSIVNQVLRDYNGLGQLITEWQSHSGAVVTSTTPKIQYAYNFNGSGTTNQSRLTSITYPSGYVLTFNYSSGINTAISRLSSLSDPNGAVESYDYLGLDTVVRRAHSGPNVDLSYIKRTGESNGDAGDQYTGLDRFGRVVDRRWLNPTTGTATDRFQYGYNQAGSRTYRDNLVNTALGEVYTYDALNQLTGYSRGTLNGTKTGITGTASRNQTWDYDAVGNWDSVTTNGTAQTRTANAQNEITSVSGATTPTYDANGNMTKDETGQQYVYDAWNRLVTVKNSGGTTIKAYTYDGLSRRVTETASGTTTDLFYSKDWQVLEEKVGSNTTNRYVWSPVYVDAMVLRDRDTNADGTLDERLWTQQDANGNATALVDGSGAVVERYVYDPFGNVTVLDASWNVRAGGSSYAMVYLWQGLRRDTVTGIYHARNRDVSPTLGRPLQSDPLGYAAGDANLYRWEGNSPITHVDPTGLIQAPPPEAIAEGWSEERIAQWRREQRERSPVPTPRTDYFKETSNFFAGWADALTFGGTNYIRDGFGYNDAVDKTTGTYGAGQVVGTVHGIALIPANPCVIAPKLGQGLQLIQGIQAGSLASSALTNAYQGNYASAALDALGAFGSLSSLLRACFAAGTPIRTPEGSRPIEDFRPGDVVLSRDEFDPSGPVEAKVIEEVFVRTAPVLDLRVVGQTIATTGEHPFFAKDRGWVAANTLERGEQILGLAGEWLRVEGVKGSGQITTVYNFRVADFHTYFVGTENWEGGVWAHNAYVSVGGRNPPISQRQAGHTDGTPGKSQFNPGVDVEGVVRMAWEAGRPIFDKNGKFIGNIFTFKNPIGTSPTGFPQNTIKVHWSPRDGIHGVPTSVGGV
ncbi:polymorphic toxin-type HINT domain-containing protein [Gemmata massiliana]|uniref:polymorphic toxin-type HINT domain-containing protein n=1 Tax=Gemmata massiliana TaxID=1210884 RepID=UPI0013A6E7C7|nr:polymorphic toxin-type HINT domain-containing protein [Gemmata massiliana]